MGMYIIIGIVIVVIVIIILVTRKEKSELLGESLSGADYTIYGDVFVLSKNDIFIESGKNATVKLFEKGIDIFQGTQSVEVPLGAINGVNSSSYSDVVNKDKSVIGRAAVGGLLFGQVGAIVGGMSGLQSSQEVVNTELFVISFNFTSGKTELALTVDKGSNVKKFINKFNELKSEFDKNIPQKEEDVIYNIGNYTASQLIEEEFKDYFYIVSYNETTNDTIIQIDARNINFTIHLKNEQKNEIKELLLKAIEWKNKAKDNKLSADKEVGIVNTKLSLSFGNELRWVEPCPISIKFNSFYEGIEHIDEEHDKDFYSISLVAPNINISEEDIDIPASVISLKTTDIKHLLGIFSDKNIQDEIFKIKNNNSKVEELLN